MSDKKKVADQIKRGSTSRALYILKYINYFYHPQENKVITATAQGGVQPHEYAISPVNNGGGRNKREMFI